EPQIEFPVIYAVARAGRASLRLSDFDDLPAGKAAAPGATPHPGEGPGWRARTLEPLLDAILETVPPPRMAETTHDKLQMLVANLDYDDYVGRLAIGRLSSGSIEVGQQVAVCRADGSTPKGKVTKIYAFEGLKKVEIPEAGPGEIISLAGLEEIANGGTIADPGDRRHQAPRGLPADGLEPRADHPGGRRPGPRADGADGLRRSAIGGRRRHRTDGPAQGPDDGDAEHRLRPGSPHLPGAGPRPGRVSQRVPHHHPRRGHHVLAVRRIRALAGKA